MALSLSTRDSLRLEERMGQFLFGKGLQGSTPTTWKQQANLQFNRAAGLSKSSPSSMLYVLSFVKRLSDLHTLDFKVYTYIKCNVYLRIYDIMVHVGILNINVFLSVVILTSLHFSILNHQVTIQKQDRIPNSCVCC